MTLKERMKQLEAARPQVVAKIASACENATIRAVKNAVELTPPTQNDLRWKNTRAGEMKQHWVTDSRTEPEKVENQYETLLANDKQYSSYVNDGHRMDRHFVPGLYINPESGQLEYDPMADVGIVVGTKTPYVEGLFMVDAAKEEYKRALRQDLAHIREVFD